MLGVVLLLVGVFLAYWVVRLAVTHALRDALREDVLTRAELEDANR